MSDSTEKRPELLDVLGAGPVGVTSPGEIARQKERMLPWLEEQVAALPRREIEQARRVRLRRFAGSAGAVVAAAAALLGALFFDGAVEKSPPPVASAPRVTGVQGERFATVVSGRLRSESGEHQDGERLALRGRFDTEGEGAALQAAQGYQIELGPASSLTFGADDASGRISDEPFVRLHHGQAKLSVLQRPDGASLRLMTSDALVVVIKSAFSIRVEEGQSCISVTEGSVRVRRGSSEEVVGVGQSSGCSEASPREETEEVSSASKRSAPPVRTTLSQENALLSRALSAESRGDRKTAQRAYRELLAKYPRSSFAQDARAGLARLEQTIK